LTSVTIPSSVTSIGEFAFYGCSGLAAVHISDIRAWCLINFDRFSNPLSEAREGLYLNGKKITTAVIPEGVTKLADNIFENCSSLTSVTIPSSVTSIGEYAFYNCRSLTSVTIPEGVTSIGSHAFRNCSGLTSMTIPKGVTEIGFQVFYDCSSLTSVTIPEGVTSIGTNAFCNCRSLTSVTFPKSLVTFKIWPFASCTSIQWVQFLEDVPAGYEDSGLLGIKTLFPREYGANWERVLSAGTHGTVVEAYSTATVSVSAEMTTPTTMKVTYTVKSDKEMVKVRAVAFKDGVRSFANLVPVKTTAESSPEAIPNGSEVTANVAHTFVWNVPSDWEEDLAKVAMEILVQEGELLPQELITIPATNTHKAMTITRNTLHTSAAFNALLWCVVEGDSALMVSNGVVKVNGTQIASGTSVSASGDQATALLNYLYGKMGYKVLTGVDLTYAEAATRLDLSTSGLTQVAVKIEEE
jgi:hypothetical protein